MQILFFLISWVVLGTVGLKDEPPDSSGTIVRIEWQTGDVVRIGFDTTDIHGGFSFDSVETDTYDFYFKNTAYYPDSMMDVYISEDKEINIDLIPKFMTPPTFYIPKWQYYPTALIESPVWIKTKVGGREATFDSGYFAYQNMKRGTIENVEHIKGDTAEYNDVYINRKTKGDKIGRAHV